MRRRTLYKNIPNNGIYEDSGDMSNNYMTIRALENGLTVSITNPISTAKYYYRINSIGDWIEWDTSTTTPSINIDDTISFKSFITSASIHTGIGTFKISKDCSLEGNCMSMIYGDDVLNTIPIDFAFCCLFQFCYNVKSVSKTFLPSIIVSCGCYRDMFYGCSLENTPDLPAIFLEELCYEGMFGNCNFTTAPELPATTLAESCYGHMFEGCTNLTTAPALPITTLAEGCYSGMFQGCTSLITAPELPATTLAESCYGHMFSGCTGLTTAPELPATTLADWCYNGMFSGCTSLTTPPELPATTLAEHCYNGMFQGCTSLITAPELPATTLAEWCYFYMFYNCSKLNYIKMLATDISASSCLSSWVSGVASTGTFVKNSAMTTLPTGDSGIPSGWTVQNA